MPESASRISKKNCMANNWAIMRRAAEREALSMARRHLKHYPQVGTADIMVTTMEHAARMLDAAKWEIFDTLQAEIRKRTDPQSQEEPP